MNQQKYKERQQTKEIKKERNKERNKEIWKNNDRNILTIKVRNKEAKEK